MQGIKNIIFDYGNVIFSIDFAKTQQAFANLGIPNVEQFFGHLQQDALFDAFDKGEIATDAFRTQLRLKTGSPDLTDTQIDDAWCAMLLGIAPGNHELLLQLKPRYRTFLLSNINDIHYNYIMRYLKTDFGFDGNGHLFEKAYYSHLMGKRKPNADIFEQVLQEQGLNPAETLFIDDSPQHLATAQKLGLNTFLMKAPDTLQQFITRSGFLS
jgi:FMN phosphatase YigB (HAD superfamily)